MDEVLLRDQPKPSRTLHTLFWMYVVIVAVGAGLLGPVLSGRGLLLVVGFLVVSGLIYLSLWQIFMKPEYVITAEELQIHFGPGAPERYPLSRIESVRRREFTLGSLRRFRANRWRDGVEILIDDDRSYWLARGYWLAPTDVEEFIRVLNEARGRVESQGAPQA
jgi:hypothetical protein